MVYYLHRIADTLIYSVNYNNMTVIYNYDKSQNSLMRSILHECKNTLFYCINNLCTLLKTLIRANAPLNCYCIFRLHKKVGYVCITGDR